MRKNTGQRRRKSEAVGKHVFCAGSAKIAPEEFLAIKNLANNRFGRRIVDVVLFHGRASDEPSACSHVLLDFLIVGWVVLLYKAIAVGPAEVKNEVRILLKKREIVSHGSRKIFTNDCWILPPPLGIQMCIGNNVQRRVFT